MSSTAPAGPFRAMTMLALVLAAMLAAPVAAQFGDLGLPAPGRDAAGEQTFNDSRDVVDVQVVPAKTQVTPGERIPIAVIFDIEDGWKLHTNDPIVPPALGSPEDYFATIIAVDAPADSPVQAHPQFIQWPEVKTVDVAFGASGEAVPYGVFKDRAIAYLPVTIAGDAEPGTTITFTVKPAFQSCDDMSCLRPTPYPSRTGGPDPEVWLDYGHRVTLEVVPLSEAGAAAGSGIDQSVFAGFDLAVWDDIAAGVEYLSFDLFGLVTFDLNVGSSFGYVLLLLVAALGGFLLNLTPCVLPIIPLKIMGLSASAHGDRARTLILGIAMFAGVIAFWLGLGLLIAFVSGFTATNQLFQYPAFTISVGVIIALMAIGMCGLFAIQLPQFVYRINPSQDSLHGSFGFGVMTAVLSTPCTAPFMGAAAAWAATQSPPTVLATFAAIGVGMGLPYFVLSAFPKLVERMPRTGPASELIKQVMGLLMLAAAAYFIGVGISGATVSPPDPPSRLYFWAVGLCGIAAGAWLAWRTLQLSERPIPRAVFGGLGIAILAISAYIGVRMTDKGPIDWVYYTPDRFEAALAEGDVVVMEFTAEWCLSCKALEESVLRSPEVVSLFGSEDVTPIKVDLTGNNTLGNAMLKRVNRLTIPLLVVFSPDGEEVFKHDFYTPEQVRAAVDKARPASRVAQRP